MRKFDSLTAHFVVTLLWLVLSLYLIFLYAPQEATMGELQRIFYIHASSAWTAYTAYFIIFLGSVAYLWKRSVWADDLAYSAGEVGFVFCSTLLVTGPIWAKPAWGIWWTWDARLTLTFVLWLLFGSYLMLRGYIANGSRAAVLVAVVGIMGFTDVPINYMAIRWWRTQHPQPVIAGGEGSGLDPRIFLTFMVCVGAIHCLFAYLVRLRMRMAGTQREINVLRHHFADIAAGE